MTHICVGKLTHTGSDNGLSPGRRQAIIWTNVGLLLIRPLGTNFSEIVIGIQTFSFKKMYLKMSSAKWRPFCLGLNVLRRHAMETLSALRTFCQRNPPVDSPHKGSPKQTLMFSLMFKLLNKPSSYDLRRHDAHCDVIVMVDLLPGDLMERGVEISDLFSR